MELIDIVLGKQYVKNNASSILRNLWVETVSMTGSKNNKQPYKNYRLNQGKHVVSNLLGFTHFP